MFQRHISGTLAQLVDGQLDRSETARADAHLAGCDRCRAALDRYRFSAAMLGRLTLVEAPTSIWTSIEATLAAGEGHTVAPRTVRTVLPRPTLALATLAVLATITLVLWQINRAPARWDVVRLDAPGGAARMAIGEWVETDASSRATIRIGDIGTVDVAPKTQMQLLVARADEHRLNLARGSISAQILAPPRLFFVETPSSTVVDLGCAYTMEVDEAGVGQLRVTSGWASLEWEGRESVVPAGASCHTRPEVGPGTPSFDDATERLREALMAFDFGGGSGALDTVLTEARERDTLTLWHLLFRVGPDERLRVFDRMVVLAPLPIGVTRDKALALDRDTLQLWREELAWTW